MRPSRGCAIVARARRPVSWSALVAIAALYTGENPAQSFPPARSVGVESSDSLIRAGIVDDIIDIIEDLLGGDSDPPPEDPDSW